MPAQLVAPGLYVIPLGVVNVFLLETDDGLALIDTGSPNQAEQIISAVQQLGKQASDIRHIILTHAHPDHIGSLAALKRASNARTYIHAADAPIARSGSGFRPLYPAPGLLTKLLFRFFIRVDTSVEASVIDEELQDGTVLPIAGGLQAIHTPGHAAGHMVFLWPRGQTLFVGDACSNLPRLSLSLGYEDLRTGQQSLARIAQLDFAIACFGHGQPIKSQAAAQFRARWH